MKQYSRVFTYLGKYKSSIAWYVVTIFLSILFSIVSIGMLLPFMQLIFGVQSTGVPKTTSNPLVTYVTDQLSNLISNGSVYHALGVVCILIIISIFLKNLFLYLSYRIMGPLKNGIVTRFRVDLFDKILKLPIGYFTEQRKGDLTSRIINDVAEVEGSVVGTLEGWIKDPMAIIINLGVLFYISPQLTGFILLSLPLMGLVIGRVSRSLKKDSSKVAQKGGETISLIDETLGGLRVIKAFNVESLLRMKFFNISDDLLVARNKIGFKRDLASPMSEMMGVAIFAGILWFGGRLVLSGELGLNGALFLTYMGLFYNIIDPAKSISTAFSNMRKGAAAIGRIEEVMSAPVMVDDNPNGKKLDSFTHSIEFRNVGFRYDDVVILKDISLTVQKGKTVALVGSSGAGKSTLADLVPRFHDASSGEILVDGVNIRDYSLYSLRTQISIVTQEPILFNDTIANNIALGMNNATQADIEQAAKVANAHHFIVQKENGYDTNIGDRGSKLSGGERQRLTIARAVLKNPPILILDEATSSLDTESERLVQDAINNLMTNRTSLVIAHRLSTIRHADEIIVLQKGEIVERGTHDSLIAHNGFYKRLVDMQEVK
ncbi:MAG: ABC transporter ATP-binding protein [Chitinophagaceae bacterium]|nr:ABC transporter ATP-binding protein [Chitinophagaceae bacterium]MBL0054764.1 ABC transporter ATP-binding protein [Chitinophagaceae bacterium]